MYARSITINGDPGSVDLGINLIRDDVMPMITAKDGCLGMSMVVDRETGRCIVSSAWRDHDAMAASRDALASSRARTVEAMRGTDMMLEEWEVAVMHRDHASRVGSCCRITWGRPTDMDDMAEFFRTVAMPQFEAMDGFCSASLFLDRTGGRSCGTVTFDSRAALEASREPAAAMREAASAAGRVVFLDVAEFELAIAHLRVPELV